MLNMNNNLSLDFFGVACLYDYIAYRLSTPKTITWNEIVARECENGPISTYDLAEEMGEENVQLMIARADRLVQAGIATKVNNIVTLTEKGEYAQSLMKRYIEANWNSLEKEHQVIIRKIMKNMTGLKTNDVETLLYAFVKRKIEIVDTLFRDSGFKYQPTRLMDWYLLSRAYMLEESNVPVTPTNLTRILPQKRFETVQYAMLKLRKNSPPMLKSGGGIYTLTTDGKKYIEKVIGYVNKRINEYTAKGVISNETLIETARTVYEFGMILVQKDRENTEKIRLNATMKFPYRQELFEHPDIF